MTSPSSSSPASSNMLPVLIVGGGPVGLFEALLLTKLGIPVRIIEREHSISPLSKALGLQARSMEIFRLAGAIDPFLEKGSPIFNLNFYSAGKHFATMPIVGTPEDTEYCYGLFMEQKVTSEILRDELVKMGVEVDYGWELMDAKVVEGGDNESTYVETTIRRALSGDNTAPGENLVIGVVDERMEQKDKAYETEVARSKYMVACDGGRSTVRHKLNIAFPGCTLTSKTFIWDGIADTDILVDGVTVISNPNKRAMHLFPLSHGTIRVQIEAGQIEDGEDFAETIKNLTIDQFEALAKDCVHPAKFNIKETLWLTGFRVNERRAEQFVYKNRIFLAGDAAHIHSPAGGQGMNTGLQDAHNLAWKVAFALQGLVAPELILPTYAEREPMADRAIKVSSAILQRNQTVGYTSHYMKLAFFSVAPFVLNVLRKFNLTPDVSMLKLRYAENYINRPLMSTKQCKDEYQVGVRAQCGTIRAINSSTDDKTNKTLRLHELLISLGRFHILIFASTTLNSPIDTKQLAVHLDHYQAAWRKQWTYSAELNDGRKDKHDLFKIHILAGPTQDTAGWEKFLDRAEGDGRVYEDIEAKVHAKFGFNGKKGPGGIVVVRPDAHVGYRVEGCQAQAWEAVDGYFSGILTKGVAHL
ncbi:FAD binding domain-containing protein [Linnemannia elongata]|nr:FAD binding domain-containing protein [Linnemannia elongata]